MKETTDTEEKKAATATTETKKSEEGKKKKEEGTPKRKVSETPSKKTHIFGIIAGIAALLLVLVFVLTSLWSRMSLAEENNTPSRVDSSQEVKRLREELRKEREKDFEVESKFTPPPAVDKRKGINTFNPTELIELPTVGRVEKHSSPNGDFYLLFGSNGRMITAGGDTINLLEPKWAITRPKGKLALLDPLPPGLTLFPGRYPVAVVVPK